MRLKPLQPQQRPVELPKSPAAGVVQTTPTAQKQPETTFKQGSGPSTSNPVETPSLPYTPHTSTVSYGGDEKPVGPLGTLRANGKLGVEMQMELNQKIVGEGAVDTRDQSRSVPLIRSADDLKQIDSEMGAKIGPEAWSQLKNTADQWASASDAVANAARLPPEGIHPDFALAGLGLMQPGASPAEAKKSDAALAAVIDSSGKGAAASCEVWLRQFGVDAKKAPQAFAALEHKLGPLPQAVTKLIAQAKNGEPVDTQLAAQLKKLPPENLLRAQHELSLAGLVNDRLTFFGATATPKLASAFPQSTAALLGRDVRHELMAPYLQKDAGYQALKAGRDQQIDAAAKHSGMPRQEIEWALLQDQKLRFLQTEVDGKPSADLSKRTISQTFFDHLRARREGNLEKDLALNYDPKIFFTSNQGNFFGHEGVRNSAANLAKLVPGREWVMNRLSFTEGKSPTEGYATEVWSAELEGRLVTAVDNFFVKDGKIAMQSAYYTDVRKDLERQPV